MSMYSSKFILAVALVASLGLAGCVTQPYGTRYVSQNVPAPCQNCGVVQGVQQVYIQGNNSNNGTIGTVIGAVAGGLLGNTIGRGQGRTAATVVGAVAGGVVGNQVGQNTGNNATTAWQIAVRMDNGQYATVTQANNPGVRPGDYVQVGNGQVYPR